MTTDTKCRRCGAAVPPAAESCPQCGLAVTAELPAGAAAATDAEDAPSHHSALDLQVLTDLRNATLGEYEILSELGRGGMATVFLAHEIALNRKVAIKVISPTLLEDNSAERFLREARTAAGLSHPNLIPIYSVRETDSLLFFVMKYVAGPTLEALIVEGKPLPIPVVRAILSETATALGYAHRRQIVHRDVKPGNIMLDDEGRVVVTDFGIARDSQSTGLTGTGMSVGTPMYMSPEQCLGETVTGASDQYSLGIVGYQLVAGKVPFEASSAVTMMYAHTHVVPRPLLEARPDCPPELASAIMRMIAKAPADRWPTIEDAIKGMGAAPLLPDDPVRQSLTDMARSGAALRRSNLPSTPRSPVPSTKNVARRAGRANATPARAAAATEAPTVMVPGAADAARPAARRRPYLAAAGVLLGAAAIAWIVMSRAKAAPAPTADASASAQPPAPAVTPPPAPAPAAAVPVPAAAGAGAAPANRLASLGITPAVSALTVGERVQLHAVPRDAAGKVVEERGTRWSTSDGRVATVSSTGLLQAATPGHAVITASLGENTSSLEVNVAAAAPAPPAATADAVAASVEVIPSTLAVARGGTGQLKAIVHDAAGRVLADHPVRWTSANPQVADVSTNGLVIGVAPGAAAITAAADGKSAVVTVTVPAAVAAAPAAPAPPAAPSDPRPAIRTMVDAYVAAIRGRNVARMLAVYPAMNSTTRSLWDKLFNDYPSVTATLVPASIDIPASGESAAFDLDMELANGREHQKLLMHFLATPEFADGTWRFRQVVQSYVTQ